MKWIVEPLSIYVVCEYIWYPCQALWCLIQLVWSHDPSYGAIKHCPHDTNVSSGMAIWFHPKLCNGCNNVSMLRVNLKHVIKLSPYCFSAFPRDWARGLGLEANLMLPWPVAAWFNIWICVPLDEYTKEVGHNHARTHRKRFNLVYLIIHLTSNLSLYRNVFGMIVSEFSLILKRGRLKEPNFTGQSVQISMFIC